MLPLASMHAPRRVQPHSLVGEIVHGALLVCVRCTCMVSWAFHGSTCMPAIDDCVTIAHIWQVVLLLANAMVGRLPILCEGGICIPRWECEALLL